MKGILSSLRSKGVRILFKLHEPFIYSICTSIVALTFAIDYFSDEPFITQEDYIERIFLMSLLGGCSLPTIIRIISYSSGLCKWYMINIFTLLLNNINGFIYFFGWIDYIPYTFIACGLSCLGVTSFLIMKLFYRITEEGCTVRR